MFGQLLPNKNKFATLLHSIYCTPTLVSKQALHYVSSHLQGRSAAEDCVGRTNVAEEHVRKESGLGLEAKPQLHRPKLGPEHGDV
jgi:hypothetical protein